MAEGILIAVFLMGVLLMPFGVGGWIRARVGRAIRAFPGEDGVQEVEIVVRGRYRPDKVIVGRGIPVRLLFNRQEDVPCSERVIFSDFQQERWLAPFATTAVQFIPTRAGEFLFTCALGMYQGRLLVEEPRATGAVGHLLHTPGLALHALNHDQPKVGQAEALGRHGGGDSEHAEHPPQDMAPAVEATKNLVPSVQVSFSPIMALFAHSASETITLPLESGQPCTVEQLLRRLEEQARGAFLQPGTSKLRRHVRVYLNRQAGVGLDRQVGAGDVIELQMQAIGGG